VESILNDLFQAQPDFYCLLDRLISSFGVGIVKEKSTVNLLK
jgi:hypothetical protein